MGTAKTKQRGRGEVRRGRVPGGVSRKRKWEQGPDDMDARLGSILTLCGAYLIEGDGRERENIMGKIGSLARGAGREVEEHRGGEGTVETLRLFNRWRRGDEDVPQPDPRLIGRALDNACDALVLLRKERDGALLELGAIQEAVAEGLGLGRAPKDADEVRRALDESR